MSLVISRFDLDETVPVGNVAKLPPEKRPTLPTGFPFIFDEEDQAVIEPALLFLVDKFAAPASFKGGRWIHKNSADASAADLKDWWAKVRTSGVPWDCADDSLVADWLIDMKVSISGKTHDFLSSETVKRRASSIGEFYRWAMGRKLVERVPEPDSAKRIANLLLNDPAVATRMAARSSKYDRDPHPISPDVAARLATALGPLPSEESDRSSRTRLAFELGYNSGMRIDEILNLDVAWFKDFAFNPETPFVMSTFEIEHTKGLVPREINIPAWLMEEIRIYIDTERTAAIRQARGSWLSNGRPEFSNLLLNQAGAIHNAGKPTKAPTIQAEFHAKCLELRITKRKILAKGTSDRKVVDVPRHTFHDTRHSFAVLYFHALESRGHQRPWIRGRDSN